MSDIKYLVFMIVTLVIMNLLFINYDTDLCPSVAAQEFNFTEFNSTDDSAYEYVRSVRCESLPNWVYLLFNSPFLLGIGLIIKKYVLI